MLYSVKIIQTFQYLLIYLFLKKLNLLLHYFSIVFILDEKNSNQIPTILKIHPVLLRKQQ